MRMMPFDRLKAAIGKRVAVYHTSKHPVFPNPLIGKLVSYDPNTNLIVVPEKRIEHEGIPLPEVFLRGSTILSVGFVGHHQNGN